MAVKYTCGWCGSFVSSVVGSDAQGSVQVRGRGRVAGIVGYLRLCPNCNHPSFIDREGNATPPSAYAEPVAGLPKNLASLYNEARDCIGINASHAAVMVGRKILMHVAVEQGAGEGRRFVEYVDYLVENNLVPPGTRDWVDEIREVGNDANHEISPITQAEARAVVDFVAMLLKLVYEFPARGAASVAARAARDTAAGT
jgi:hypothetical protein